MAAAVNPRLFPERAAMASAVKDVVFAKIFVPVTQFFLLKARHKGDNNAACFAPQWVLKQASSAVWRLLSGGMPSPVTQRIMELARRRKILRWSRIGSSATNLAVRDRV